MAGFVSTQFAGIQDPLGARAAARITANMRARASTGFVGTAADVPMFPLFVGSLFLQSQWLVPDTRCLVQGVPTVSQSSVGQAYLVGILPIPGMVTVQPDPRVKTT